MANNYISISIPSELKQFEKIVKVISSNDETEEFSKNDFGVKLIKNDEGQVSEALYYSNTGDLLKKIFYSGSSIYRIEYYRDNKMRVLESYTMGKLLNKCIYDKFGQLYCTFNYEYHQKDLITSIKKIVKDKHYKVEYEYDDCNRINCRILILNSQILDTQKFKYDVIDRIIEYKDNNQEIKVEKINTNNELIKYTISDIIGNKIEIWNKFLCSDYVGTEIELNGHKTSIKDRSYVDNVMLKRPYATEDDLDLAMSCILDKKQLMSVTRTNKQDISDSILKDRVNDNTLPISIRKLHLINNNN